MGSRKAKCGYNSAQVLALAGRSRGLCVSGPGCETADDHVQGTLVRVADNRRWGSDTTLILFPVILALISQLKEIRHACMHAGVRACVVGARVRRS